MRPSQNSASPFSSPGRWFKPVATTFRRGPLTEDMPCERQPFGSAIATDFTARLFAERLAERWKQPVVVENRPGADGMIGVNAFVAMRDDHTLLFSFAAPISLWPMLYEKLAYDPARELVPIAAAVDNFLSVTASASLNVGSLGELAALARSQP